MNQFDVDGAGTGRTGTGTEGNADDDNDEETWWYICLICNQVFEEEIRLRQHRRIQHVSRSSKTISILNQFDLLPSINLTRCSIQPSHTQPFSHSIGQPSDYRDRVLQMNPNMITKSRQQVQEENFNICKQREMILKMRELIPVILLKPCEIKPSRPSIIQKDSSSTRPSVTDASILKTEIQQIDDDINSHSSNNYDDVVIPDAPIHMEQEVDQQLLLPKEIFSEIEPQPTRVSLTNNWLNNLNIDYAGSMTSDDDPLSSRMSQSEVVEGQEIPVNTSSFNVDESSTVSPNIPKQRKKNRVPKKVPFQCKLCYKTFFGLGTLNSHVLIKHVPAVNSEETTLFNPNILTSDVKNEATVILNEIPGSNQGQGKLVPIKDRLDTVTRYSNNSDPPRRGRGRPRKTAKIVDSINPNILEQEMIFEFSNVSMDSSTTIDEVSANKIWENCKRKNDANETNPTKRGRPRTNFIVVTKEEKKEIEEVDLKVESDVVSDDKASMEISCSDSKKSGICSFTLNNHKGSEQINEDESTLMPNSPPIASQRRSLRPRKPRCLVEPDSDDPESLHDEDEYNNENGTSDSDSDLESNCDELMETNSNLHDRTSRKVSDGKREKNYKTGRKAIFYSCNSCFCTYRDHHSLKSHVINVHSQETREEGNIVNGEDICLENDTAPSANFNQGNRNCELASATKQISDSQDESINITQTSSIEESHHTGENKTFNCRLCYIKPFRKLLDVNLHIVNMHKDHIKNIDAGSSCACLQCFKQFLVPSEHIMGHFDCKFCRTPLREVAIRTHILKQHNDVDTSNIDPKKSSDWICKLKSDIINQILPTVEDGGRNEGKNNSEGITKEFPCTFCDKAYTTKKYLRFHFQEIHLKTKPIVCEICQKTYQNVNNLRKHQASVHATNTREFLCSTCGMSFISQSYLQGHIRRIHTEDIFECNICGHPFNTRRKAKLHEVTHSKVKKFLCTICGGSYKTKIHLGVHTRLYHTSALAYKCNECNATFNLRLQLRRHAAVHVTDRSFQCTKCSKSFRIELQLKDHTRRTHDKCKKPSICNLCNKEFPGSYSLERHLIEIHANDTEAADSAGVHIKKKFYECKLCQQKFPTPSTLKSHNRQHVNERNWECTICGNKFKSNSNLKQHLVTHQNKDELKYECEKCGKKFGFPGTLREHGKRVHGEQSFTYLRSVGKKE